jgi:hypothetical protein
VKTALAIAGIVALVVVFNAINNAYCAWQPDTVIGQVVKWSQWDGRRC